MLKGHKFIRQAALNIVTKTPGLQLSEIREHIKRLDDFDPTAEAEAQLNTYLDSQIKAAFKGIDPIGHTISTDQLHLPGEEFEAVYAVKAVNGVYHYKLPWDMDRLEYMAVEDERIEQAAELTEVVNDLRLKRAFVDSTWSIEPTLSLREVYRAVTGD